MEFNERLKIMVQVCCHAIRDGATDAGLRPSSDAVLDAAIRYVVMVESPPDSATTPDEKDD